MVNSLNQLWKYLISGYLIERRKILKKVQIPNVFVPNYQKTPQCKIAVYTINNGYDYIHEPEYIDNSFDYYIFTDLELDKKSIWKRKSIQDLNISDMTPLMQARYIKTHPHIFFPEYDYTIYIDGNICILSDIRPLVYTMIAENKKMAVHRHQSRDCIYREAKVVYAKEFADENDIRRQMEKYREDKFPKHYGLFETNVLIRKHNDPDCIEIMEDWWRQIQQYTKRDQLSFTYVLWKHGYSCSQVLSLGNNSRNSSYFRVEPHKEHFRKLY